VDVDVDSIGLQGGIVVGDVDNVGLQGAIVVVVDNVELQSAGHSCLTFLLLCINKMTGIWKRRVDPLALIFI
jgi:hypothetical protein